MDSIDDILYRSIETAKKYQDWVITGERFIVADIDSNEVVDITDFIKILRHIAANNSDTVKSKYPDWVIDEEITIE